MFCVIDFSPMIPEFGIMFWTTIVFILLWIFLGKMAFGPISDALEKRENHIQSALDSAEAAKKEMSSLKAENDKILSNAREERMKIMKEAKEAKEQIIKEARDKASSEASRILSDAQLEIESQKKQATFEVKKSAGKLAIDIAEKVIQKEIGNNQDALIASLLKDIKLN